MPAVNLLMPVLNVGRLSEVRFKFSFVTNIGTLFSEVSVIKGRDDQDLRSDAQKRTEALRRLKMIAQELDSAIADPDPA